MPSRASKHSPSLQRSILLALVGQSSRRSPTTTVVYLIKMAAAASRLRANSNRTTKDVSTRFCPPAAKFWHDPPTCQTRVGLGWGKTSDRVPLAARGGGGEETRCFVGVIVWWVEALGQQQERRSRSEDHSIKRYQTKQTGRPTRPAPSSFPPPPRTQTRPQTILQQPAKQHGALFHLHATAGTPRQHHSGTCSATAFGPPGAACTLGVCLAAALGA